MLTKKEFCTLAQTYFDFDNYLDKLADLSVNIFDEECVGWFRDNYVYMVNKLMGCERHDDYLNELEEYMYNYQPCPPEEFYDKFFNPKNKFYSIDDEDNDDDEDNLVEGMIVDFSDLKKIFDEWLGDL